MFKRLFESVLGGNVELVKKLVLLLLTAVAISIIGSQAHTSSSDVYAVGEVATRTITAPRDLLIEDVSGTEEKRLAASSQIRPVLLFKDKSGTDVRGQIQAFFDVVASYDKDQPIDSIAFSKEDRVEIETRFRIDFVGDEWGILGQRSEWEHLRQLVAEAGEPIVRRGVVANKGVISDLVSEEGAKLLLESTGAERDLEDANSLYGLADALELARETARTSVKRDKAYLSLVNKLLGLVIRPNVSFDAQETERRISNARLEVEPIYYKIRRGEVIIRTGDVVTPLQHWKLVQMRDHSSASTLLPSIVANTIITLFALWLLYAFAQGAWGSFRPTVPDVAVLSVTLVISIMLLYFFAVVAAPLTVYAPQLGQDALIWATPVASGGILLQVILGLPTVFLFSLAYGLLSAVVFDLSWEIPILIIVANFVGALSVKDCHRRSAFISASLRVAAASIVVLCCFLLSQPTYTVPEIAVMLLCVLFGALSSGVLGSSLAPVAEHAGSYITDVKLLELSSLDNPLLRDLSVQAPGTWNHSMVMGQMAKSAAEAIGANALLARVGAYYHDIGKAKKPAYFVENQTSKENRHDKLTPSMSALIIRAHVKDGIEMAKRRRLPQAIVDLIPQHHGTALIEYFYEKAKKEAEEGETVDETHYRYPGPKPQTKEAGILMLADGVEAAARTVQDPTPAKLQGVVQKIINKIFASGELDECELTLKDLHEIAKSFSRVLTGIYHRRIEYSEPAEKRAKVVEEEGDQTAATQRMSVKQLGLVGEAKSNGRRDSSEGDGKQRGKRNSSDGDTENGSRETLKRLGNK